MLFHVRGILRLINTDDGAGVDDSDGDEEDGNDDGDGNADGGSGSDDGRPALRMQCYRSCADVFPVPSKSEFSNLAL